MRESPIRQQALGNLSDGGEEAQAALESLLFVASEPVEMATLAAALDWSPAEVEQQIEHLADSLKQDRRGITVQRNDDRVQLVSAPRFGPIVERFLAVERKARLSEAGLETLAILAFRQPVTRAEVEAIRGVDCSGVLSTLVARELIEVVGRRPTVGNPIEYGTTDAFLRQFGLASLEELTVDDEA